MQPTPVVDAIKLIIAKERKTSKSPAIENPIVFFAWSIFLGSPPEIINLIPPIIIKTMAIVPTSKTNQ